MSIFKRAINIIKSNINSSKSEGVEFSNFEFQDEMNSYETSYDEDYENEFSYKEELSSEEKMEREYYGNLELPLGASFDDIKKQYRALLKKYHPDKFQGNERKRKLAEKVVSKLNSAYSYFEQKYKE